MIYDERAIVAADGRIPVTLVEPETEGGPAVVVVPSIFGVDDDLIAHLRAFARAGAAGIAFDPFWRDDPGPLPGESFERALARGQRVDDPATLDDLRRVVAEARSLHGTNGRVLVLGICFGGRFAMRAAIDDEADAVATWHGTRMTDHLDRAGDVRCPLSLHFGDADPLVPMADVQLLRNAFDGRDDVEITVHPDAGHGFSMPSSSRYQERAAERASAATVELIQTLQR